MTDGLDWTAAGPRSRRFNDVYFSAEDGLAESRAVFLQGCGLPDAWRGRSRFVVGELGFGSGLNAAALLDLWRQAGPAEGRLHLFSIEAYPLSAESAARALSAWPELSEVTRRLVAAWPDGRAGFHRLAFPDWRVTIDLAVMEAEDALSAWSGRADAWFLDGFAPARNPEMWTPSVLEKISEKSAPGAVAATYTVAGAVRRGLQAGGFTVEKRPGYGGKRERLEARLAGAPVSEPTPPTVAVIGGGVAGAALVRALVAQGVTPTLVDEETGDGASWNPAALVTPRLDAGLGRVARLYAQAFARAVDLCSAEAPEAILARGALQLARTEKDQARFEALAGWNGFGPGALAPLSPEQTAAALGEPPGPMALRFREGLTLEPQAVLPPWLDGARRVPGRAARLERIGESWRILDGDGRLIVEAQVVCLACALDAARLSGLPALRPVRGQVSWSEAPERTAAAAWGGYAIPTRTGVLFGATHDRGDLDRTPRAEDDGRNLRSLAVGRPSLAARLADRPISSRASTRATTPDHLPWAGAVPNAPELYTLAGLGGRGFTLAPLLAEHLAAKILGAPSPLPRDLAEIVSPARIDRAGP